MAKSPRKTSGRKPLSPEEQEARKTALKNEPKDAKFKRLAVPRIRKALSAIKQIGNLASSQYEYTPEQITKIFSALNDAFNASEAKFNAPKLEAEKSAFDL
jgi:hypothetical protein